jgi:hypothetical protein
MSTHRSRTRLNLSGPSFSTSSAASQGGRQTTFTGHGIAPEIVGTPGREGFRVEPRRWKVEQTFGCLQRYRRLRVDDEASLATSRAMTLLASVFMTGMRLERMLQA